MLENLDEVMGDLKDPEEKEPTELSESAQDIPVSNETEECFELSGFHECREEQFRVSYETMRNLKEEKNQEIESLQQIVEDMKLESRTLKFIISSIENPQLIANVIEENAQLVEEKKELEGILCLRNLKIRDLEQQPEIEHRWQKLHKPVNRSYPNDLNIEPEHQKEIVSDSDINDFQRLANLKLSGHSREDPQTKPLPKVPVKQKTFICNKCDLDHKSSEELEEHIDSHYEDGDFACDSCLFQSNKLRLLKNHLNMSPGYSSGQVHGKSAIKCNFCDERFIGKRDLVDHKHMKHETYKTCDYFKEGQCKRNPCRFGHKILEEGKCVCFQCGLEFADKTEMYRHRKTEHTTEVCKKKMKKMKNEKMKK